MRKLVCFNDLLLIASIPASSKILREPSKGAELNRLIVLICQPPALPEGLTI